MTLFTLVSFSLNPYFLHFHSFIYLSLCPSLPLSLASHTLLAKNKAEGSGDRAYNVSFHSPCIGGETYFMCTCYMWMSQVVVRVVEPAMERVPEIVMVAIVCQSLNHSQKQVHMRYVSPPIHGEWNETLYARSPDPSALFFARRVWLARLLSLYPSLPPSFFLLSTHYVSIGLLILILSDCRQLKAHPLFPYFLEKRLAIPTSHFFIY